MQKFEERKCVIFENEGQTLFGMLHHPLPRRKAPVVLMCHGFAGNKVGKFRIYVQLAQRLAKAGIATLRFDFRGSGDSEGDFSDMTIDGEVSDVLKGLEFLRNEADIDHDRIGILGNSFGGAIAVLAAQRDGNIKSLVLLAALFNSEPWKKHWETLMTKPNSENSAKEMSRILDGYTPGSGFYKGFFKLDLKNPLEALQAVPLLHIHSEKDERVGIDQANHYKETRKNAQAETRLIRLTKCDHDFSVPEERSMLVEETANWFLKTL